MLRVVAENAAFGPVQTAAHAISRADSYPCPPAPALKSLGTLELPAGQQDPIPQVATFSRRALPCPVSREPWEIPVHAKLEAAESNSCKGWEVVVKSPIDAANRPVLAVRVRTT